MRGVVTGAFLAITLLIVCDMSFEAGMLAAVAGAVAGAVLVLDYAERRRIENAARDRGSPAAGA